MTVSKEKNREYQQKWLKENKKVFYARRVLERALGGKNVTYGSLQNHGLENRLNEINKARAALEPPAKPIIATLIDNIDSADLARAVEQTELMREQTVTAEQIQKEAQAALTTAQNSMITAVRDKPRAQQVPLDNAGQPVTTLTVDDNRMSLPLDPELFPKADENEVSWTDIYNFFQYVYNAYTDGRVGLPENVRRVLVNRTYDDRTDADTFIASYPEKGWESRFAKGQLANVVLTMSGCRSVKDTSLLKCLMKKDADKQYHVINEISKKAANTQTSYANMITFMLDRYPNIYVINPALITFHKALVKFANKGKDQADVEKKAKGETARRTETLMQMPFQEIQDFAMGHNEFKNVKLSQVNLFLALYKEVPVRDNFGNVKIYKDQGSIKVGIKHPNMLYLPSRGKASFYLNKYKTQAKYGPKVYSLSSELSKLIRDSLLSKPREYLFVLPDSYDQTPVENKIPAANASNDHPIVETIMKPVMEAIQKKFGNAVITKPGVDELRKSVVGEAHAALDKIQLTKKKDPGYAQEQKQLLAKRMTHAVETANKDYANIPLHEYKDKFTGKVPKLQAWEYNGNVKDSA